MTYGGRGGEMPTSQHEGLGGRTWAGGWGAWRKRGGGDGEKGPIDPQERVKADMCKQKRRVRGVRQRGGGGLYWRVAVTGWRWASSVTMATETCFTRCCWEQGREWWRVDCAGWASANRSGGLVSEIAGDGDQQCTPPIWSELPQSSELPYSA
ncbi:hypothetical protein B0H19DRAFT_1072866 [Mycena capillaripes]|nr:hypothetical protein B0H19DRAFT_1072866 [Mycena capillaripes]